MATMSATGRFRLSDICVERLVKRLYEDLYLRREKEREVSLPPTSSAASSSFANCKKCCVRAGKGAMGS